MLFKLKRTGWISECLKEIVDRGNEIHWVKLQWLNISQNRPHLCQNSNDLVEYFKTKTDFPGFVDIMS